MSYNPTENDPEHQKRLILAVVISTIVMGLWYYFYQMPLQHAKQEAQKQVHAAQLKQKQEEAANTNPESILATVPTTAQGAPAPSREEVLKLSPRVNISNGRLHGSIRLIGARLDDITLVNYREKLAKNSPEVALMNPKGAKHANFIDIGWIAEGNLKTPDGNSLWTLESGATLTPETPVTISWDNGQGQKFYIDYSVDKNYMFNINQRLENNSGAEVKFLPYGLISKAEKMDEENFILHTGPMGVMDGTITEVAYSKLRKEPRQEFNNSTGWIGITDKYWFKSLIPQRDETYKATFQQSVIGDIERFQVDYLGTSHSVKPGTTSSYKMQIFTGAKELKLLEKYAVEQNIPHFERAIDFGWFHFITKPMYYTLIKFYSWLGNFGLAILLLTLCVKLLLFPLARKGYISMGRLKQLQPKISELQKRYKDDKLELQKNMMALYKKEKVNPAAGCLPIILQIPIFFSLYKVFFVSIEMRHAPFFGWIKDLSERDPTSLFNAFGLLPYDVPSFLMIGVFPCIMGVTMYIQQLLQPAPADPMTAKMLRMMPLIFLFMFASFPAGLVIYWCFSNTLTILQQLYFLRNHPRKS